MRTLLAAAALFWSVGAVAQAPTPIPTRAPLAPNYAHAGNWLCLPGRADVCGRPLPTTALNANGFGSIGQVRPVADPPIDCFYVYPTVSRDLTDNSDLVAGAEEEVTTAVQFARFATLCRPFAPIYRQVTLTALARALASGDRRPPASFDVAYADVAAAWRRYLQNDNRGRPFVLIGHSQGAFHLQRLLASEIEGRPEAQRMLSALIIGANVDVPEGRVVGGTFQRTPLCTRTGQLGCVVTYVSFRAASPPPERALFGRAAEPGRTVGCTNPARLGSTATVPLDSYWYAGPSVTNTQTQIAWSSEGAAPTAFLRTEGLVSAACVNRGRLGYLAVTVNADPADARTDRIPGDVVILGQLQPGWGLHLVDVNLTMGDLLRVVAAQRDAWLRQSRRRR